MSYYINKTISGDFEKAVSDVKAQLQEEGFGVISEIDIDQKLKEKLNVDFRKYKILGACNPPAAYEALQKENKIGTMLPCNVIVQQLAENEIEVAAVNPIESMQAVKNEDLEAIATGIKSRLENVINKL